MKVKLKTNYAKAPDINGYAGDVIDLPEAEAEQLITQEYAEGVPEKEH